MNYIQILLKIVIGTVMLLVYSRLGGRSQIHPLSVSEVISSIVVGSLISGSLFDSSIPVWTLAAVIAIWCLAFIVVRKIKSRRVRAELLIDGKAARLVQDGRLMKEAFEDINMSLRDFDVLIHQDGVNSVQDLAEVWYEANGKLTIVRKGEKPNSVLLIENGQVIKEKLAAIGRDTAWLEGQLAEQGLQLHSTYYAEWHNEKLYAQAMPG